MSQQSDASLAIKQRCLFSLLKHREPQNINWLEMNAHIFLGLLLYWNETKAIPTKGFPRWGLAYVLGIPSPSKSSLTVRFCLYPQEEEEENAVPWQYKEKRNEDNHNILSICTYYTAGHCLSLTWVWYNKLPFGCSRKGRAKVKGCSCVCTTDIIF